MVKRNDGILGQLSYFQLCGEQNPTVVEALCSHEAQKPESKAMSSNQFCPLVYRVVK